jgi:glycosyltransferase involved in cell wall biosynthesis
VLSVIITALNETQEELETTIKTIRNYSWNVEIIIVDDYSDIPVKVSDPTVKIYRNPKRVGCAPSRTLGASKASNKYLLFTDSHMVFHPNWYNAFLEYSINQPENAVFCGVCLGLDNENKDIYKHKGKYSGARLALWEEKENQVMEGKWIPEKNGDLYEISCLMGALYFINREYFNELRGLSELKMWGSDEPCLSLKVLLSGGKILLAKNIQAGHIFRNTAPYRTNMSFLVYNKIRMAKTLLPDDLAQKLIDKLPRDGDYYEAMRMVENERNIIEECKKYYKSIFSTDIHDICKKFNIQLP